MVESVQSISAIEAITTAIDINELEEIAKQTILAWRHH